MAVCIAVTVVAFARLKVFRQTPTKRIRWLVAIITDIELHGEIVSPRQFLIPSYVVTCVKRAILVQTTVESAVYHTASPGGVIAFRCAVAIAVAHVVEEAQFDGNVECKFIFCREAEVFLPSP